MYDIEANNGRNPYFIGINSAIKYRFKDDDFIN